MTYEEAMQKLAAECAAAKEKEVAEARLRNTPHWYVRFCIDNQIRPRIWFEGPFRDEVEASSRRQAGIARHGMPRTGPNGPVDSIEVWFGTLSAHADRVP